MTLVRINWRLIAGVYLLLSGSLLARGRDAAGKPAQKPADNSTVQKKADIAAEKAALPFLIQLLETHIRFEANGDSRKEVHTVVRIIDPVGARQFARLAFDYDRAYQQVEIPLVRVTHANEGTSEILPSAVTDAPNPAVVKYPAYQDLRVKSVRILGLQEGDIIDYRVVTTTTKAPLAPDFWLEHTFDRSGQVLKESYQLELPKPREVRLQTTPDIAAGYSQPQTATDADHIGHRWDFNPTLWGKDARANEGKKVDVVVTTFRNWSDLSAKLSDCVQIAFGTGVWTDSMIRVGAKSEPVPEQSLYDLVSSKIATVDVALAFNACPLRSGEDILKSGYGSPLEKVKLLTVLLAQHKGDTPQGSAWPYFYTKAESPETELPRPSLLSGVLVSYTKGKQTNFLDPGLEVAPYGMIPAEVRGGKALSMNGRCEDNDCWTTIPQKLPFPSVQRVKVDATLDKEGALKAHVAYTMRGDNELLLREAFHQTAKEKWKDVAGLLALSDGFRGVITNATASDPLATREPFTVEYELKQEKFVDWTKKPVRIPALLPQIGLPDGTARKNGAIELGTPLDVETQVTLHLPTGTAVQAPAGIKVERDYATYSSKYGSAADTLTGMRHIHFVLREIPGDRAMDYDAFERVVQNDQSQYFVLDRGAGVKAAALQ